MKVHSIKSRFIVIFLMGALFVIFIASIGVYGTIKGREEVKRHYEDNRIIVNTFSHLKEDMMETRNRLLTMMAERDKENIPVHRLEMMVIDADIETDFDAILDSGLIGNGTGIGEKLLEARSVWVGFKKTRYETLVPLIVAGKDKEAREVGSGIQQERYIRMRGLLNEAIQMADGYLEERDKQLEANGRSLVIGIILLSGACVIIGAVIFYAYSRDIIKRIKSLDEASRRLSGGDMSTRVQVEGGDEIASLGETFNWMASSIQEGNDLLLKNERELREKNAKLNEAMIEVEQNSKVLEHEAKRREEQNRRLQDTVLELEAVNRNLGETQEKLLQTEKMASVGQLAAGVAHEINNPLGYVNGNLSALSAYIEDIKCLEYSYKVMLAACNEGRYERVKELAGEINGFREEKDMDYLFEDLSKLVTESKEGLSRVTSIVKDLKQFSHTGEAEAKEYDINKGLESTLNIVWNEIKYTADVKKEYGDIPLVYCYPQELNQVFMNLLVNAAHAIGDKNPPKSPFDKGGVSDIPPLQKGFLSDIPPLQKGGEGGFNGKGLIKIKTYHDGENVFVEISDNGCGIPEDKIGKIFDPFFTTKEVGKGTGLGLSVVYNIVKKHKGDVDVKSRVGEGTTFTIRVPVNATHEELLKEGMGI